MLLIRLFRPLIDSIWRMTTTPYNVLRISVARRGRETTAEKEAATQFCVELSRVRGYLEFE